MSLRSITPKIGRLSCKKCPIFEPRTGTNRLRTSKKVPFAPSHRRLQDSMVKNQNDQRTMSLRSINLKIGRLSGNYCSIFKPIKATGRFRTSNKEMCIRDRVPSAPSHCPLQDSMVKNQNDPRTMSLRSRKLKIGRLSGNKCVTFEPGTVTGRFKTSKKVPFAPSHRPLQDSMVKNQNDPRTMSLRSINLKICRLSGN